MFSGTVGEMDQLEQSLLASMFAPEVKLASTKYASKDFAMLDVLPPGCTKGAALADWAKAQGLQRDEILAVGDNHNDFEMLKFAGIAVVMQNCVPELKTYGWHETHSNDESWRRGSNREIRLERGGFLRLILPISLGAILMAGAPNAGADYLVLRSGVRLNVSAYQLLGDRYRIQINGGSAEIAAAEVVSNRAGRDFCRYAPPAVDASSFRRANPNRFAKIWR